MSLLCLAKGLTVFKKVLAEMFKAALDVGDLVIQIPWDTSKVSSFVVMYQHINKSQPS